MMIHGWVGWCLRPVGYVEVILLRVIPVAQVGKIQFGGVAQLGEHLLCKQGVTGSIPVVSTTRVCKANA
jgi:hypothetical protein